MALLCTSSRARRAVTTTVSPLMVKTGELMTPTSTGNSSVTGVGFKPTVVMFFTNKCATGSVRANAMEMIGWCMDDGNFGVDDQGHSRAMTTTDNVGTTSTAAGSEPGPVCFMKDNSSTAAVNTNFYSMDSDGFTLAYTAVDTVSYPVQWLAIAGEGLSAAQGTFNTGTGSANFSVTGTGFTPKILFTISSRNTTGSGYSTVSLSTGKLTFGTAVSSSSRWSVSYASLDNRSAASTTDRIDDAVTHRSYGVGSLDFVSFDADGFTIDPVVAFSGNNTAVPWLCLGGANLHVAVGTDSQKTSTGTKSVTGFGFKPQLLILCGCSATSLNGDHVDLRVFFGVAGSASDQRAIAICDADSADPTSSKSASTANSCVYYVSGGTPSVDAAAALQTFDNDGFTLNYTTADATARLLGYIGIALS